VQLRSGVNSMLPIIFAGVLAVGVIVVLSMMAGPVCAMIWPQYVGAWHLTREFERRNIPVPKNCVDDLAEICANAYKREVRTQRGISKYFGLSHRLDGITNEVEAYILGHAEISVVHQLLSQHGVMPKYMSKDGNDDRANEAVVAQEVLFYQNNVGSSGALHGHFTAKNDAVMLSRLEKIRSETLRIRRATLPGTLAGAAEAHALVEMNEELRKLYADHVLAAGKTIQEFAGRYDRRLSRSFEEAHTPTLGWNVYLNQVLGASNDDG